MALSEVRMRKYGLKGTRMLMETECPRLGLPGKQPPGAASVRCLLMPWPELSLAYGLR